MGRYDNNAFITIAPDDFPGVLGDTPKLGKSRVRLDGDYNQYEIRINLVPYTEHGDLLLYKAIRRQNRRTQHTLEIPQAIVEVPEYFEVSRLNKEGFQRILLTNLYLPLVDGSIKDVSDPRLFDLDAFYSLLGRMGLRGGGLVPTFWFYPDNDVMIADHCVDIYLMLKVEYTEIEADFVYIPTGLFEQYCESRNPASYATTLGFYPEDYDETSSDFRMNPKGKAQVCAALKWMRMKHIIR